MAEQTRVAALIIPSDAPRCATLCLLWLQGYVPGRSVPTPAVGRCSRTRTPTQRLTKRCRPLWWQYLSSSSNSKCEALLFRTSCWDSNYKKKKCEMISSTASCSARSAQNKYLFYSSVNLSLGFFFFYLLELIFLAIFYQGVWFSFISSTFWQPIRSNKERKLIFLY